MPDKIRFGVIGCGGISLWHINAIKNIEGAKLTAVCDANLAAAEKFGKQFGVPWFTELDEILAKDIVDAVSICTPSGLHAEMAEKAFDSGKHVVVEKPLAITPQSLERVLRKQKECGVSLCVISQLRYSDGVKEAKRLVDDGQIGKILLADLSMKYYRSPDYYKNSWRGTLKMDGGGALINQGIHGVDLLCYLCGGIREIHARAASLVHPIETEDTLAADILLKDGGMGVLTAATSAFPGHKRRLEICGSKGSLVFEEDQLVSVQTKNINKTLQASGRKYGTSDPLAIEYEGHLRQISDFVDCLLTGRPYPVDGTEAAKTLAVIFAAYESQKTGQAVHVKNWTCA